MWRQTSGWVTCAKPSRRNNQTLNRVFLTHLVGVFLKQNYPKYISDVVSKILEEIKTIIRCFVWICDLPEIEFPVVKAEKCLFPIFLIFHRTDFGGFLICC